MWTLYVVKRVAISSKNLKNGLKIQEIATLAIVVDQRIWL
jgi:hypothetical protein